MIRNDDFLGELAKKMEQLGMTVDVPLEIAIGGTSSDRNSYCDI